MSDELRKSFIEAVLLGYDKTPQKAIYSYPMFTGGEIARVRNLATLPRCAGFGGYENFFQVIKEGKYTASYQAFQKDTKLVDLAGKKLSVAQVQTVLNKANPYRDNQGEYQGGIVKFLNWYFNHYFVPKLNGQKVYCAYCGVEETACAEYLRQHTKRDRGGHLEVERLNTAGNSNIYTPKNCALICYVCNNAKSDFMDEKQFAGVAHAIKEHFWNKVL